jgi:tetratricopeptide (TPR) repeat protein
MVANCNRIIEQRKHYYYDRGMNLYNNKEYINAAKEFDKALKLDERYFDAQYMCGMSNYFIGDYSAALPYFAKASESRQENIAVKLKLAECYINTINARGKGRYVRLKAYFNDVIIPLGYKNRDAQIMSLRYYLAEKNKLPEAEKIIEGFLRDGENSADFYAALAQFNLKKNNIYEAGDIVLKHFSYTPVWMKTMELVIAQFKSAGNYDVLEKIYIKMIEQVGTNSPTRRHLQSYTVCEEKARKRKSYSVRC